MALVDWSRRRDVLRAHLREQAGMDERRHLARAMHDGIAQEIAAVGFTSTKSRYAAQQAGLDGTGTPGQPQRAEVARILIDLRNDITDLRVGLRPEHGLGAAVSARLQQFGATTGAVVTVVLRESASGLPAATEVRLTAVAGRPRRCPAPPRPPRRGRTHRRAPHFQFTIKHSGATSLSVARTGTDSTTSPANSR
ncbi:MAG: hypothetical protein IPP00_00620 [Actinomycetales bacterium]|uniref:Signal transduction histidine kinase subgroup 3 dimerisation and phosphoacceptor domain-containing protein n=1 Tax=Candidatus Phosphoribacter hodrii TaxID=2953743 RepID=A0A9D7T6Q2_9MICO|nr:hypothetical protein [Candidatus Phosphoribacter hodrii]